MVDQFVGTWKMSLSENFDEYMRAIGVGMASRQVGNVIKPKFIVSVAEGVISMKTQSTFKSTEIKFKLDEEFEERTADDRVTKTIVSFINGKLVQKQTWDGRSTTLERALESGKLITTCTAGDVVAVRTYEREA
ncbi:fatty acid binding protein 4b [Gadus morhua]|uniref:fatty acid binding protein 4b n=1 Tax=Gadus morhua TaxID=8049 RepID=UPI00023F0B9C|nr:fatty acid-binding protein, liver-like [Gadus morhua]